MLVDLEPVIVDQPVVVVLYFHYQVHSRNLLKEADIDQSTVVGMVDMRKMKDRGEREVVFHSLMEECCSLAVAVDGMFGVLDPSCVSSLPNETAAAGCCSRDREYDVGG